MLNIVIALRIWAKFWEHSQMHIHCDNMVVVQVVSSSKTKDKFLAASIRNIWLISSIFDFDIVIVHIQGKNNVVADCLSRLYSCRNVDPMVLGYLKNNYVWDHIDVKHFSLNFNHIISGTSIASSPIFDAAWSRIQMAFRPATVRAHHSFQHSFQHFYSVSHFYGPSCRVICS